MKEYFRHTAGQFQQIFHTQPTVAFYGKENDKGLMEISVARCSVNEQYCKRDGREIAQRRMAEHGPQFIVRLKDSHEFNAFCDNVAEAVNFLPQMLPTVSKLVEEIQEKESLTQV